jgi:hypothetical protein
MYGNIPWLAAIAAKDAERVRKLGDKCPESWRDRAVESDKAVREAAAVAIGNIDASLPRLTDGCPQVGTGGHHSESYYDGESCAWCGADGQQELQQVIAESGLS